MVAFSARNLFSFLVIGFVFYLCSPLLLPVVMGGIFAVLFFPWLERLERLRFSTSVASALLSFGISLLFLLPSVIFVFLGAKSGLAQLRDWRDTPRGSGVSLIQELSQIPVIRGLIRNITQWFPVQTQEVLDAAEDLAKGVGIRLTDALGSFVTHLPSLIMGIAVMLVSIYFFLVDARRFMTFIRQHSFFSRPQTEHLIHAFASTCRSVILATVVSGFIQSALFSLACLLTGTSNVALIAFLVFLASFIPVIGSVPITVGVALEQLLVGNKAEGVLLLIVAAIVGLIDNFIRPAVIKGSANLHPLLAFVAVFGGLQIFGFPGVFIGPIMAALGVATLENLLDHQTWI